MASMLFGFIGGFSLGMIVMCLLFLATEPMSAEGKR